MTSGSRWDRDPRAYTPKYLADKILTSRSTLEGERKQVTVMFADVAGSTGLAGQLDPEGLARTSGRLFSNPDGGDSPLRRLGQPIHG